MKIRTKLLLMAAAILIPVIVASGMALETIREDGRQTALRGLRDAARATALIVDREVQGSLSALKALGSSPNLEARDFKAFYAQAAAFKQMTDTWTVLFDDKGAQLVNSSLPYGTVLPPPRPLRTEVLRKVLSSQNALVTDLTRIFRQYLFPGVERGNWASWAWTAALPFKSDKKWPRRTQFPLPPFVFSVPGTALFVARGRGRARRLGRRA